MSAHYFSHTILHNWLQAGAWQRLTAPPFTHSLGRALPSPDLGHSEGVGECAPYTLGVRGNHPLPPALLEGRLLRVLVNQSLLGER